MFQLKQIHAYALRSNSLPSDPDNILLYSKILNISSLHDLNYTINLFYQIRHPNSFIWNTLIRACAHSTDHKSLAITAFCEMLCEGIVLPDKHTFPFVLKACAYLFALFEGRQVHGQAVKRGFESDVYINNSLVHFYSSCGCLKDADDVFEKMPERSLVSWNVMINALVEYGEFEDALRVFSEMQRLFNPDGYTLQSVIGACAGLRALSLGVWAHAYVLRMCELDEYFGVLVDKCLVDMYCKCGDLNLAFQVFENMSKKDVNAWNSMILGFGMHGEVESALMYFKKMVDEEGLQPNSITFVGLLNVCKHRGLTNEGREIFHKMVKEYEIVPDLEHYGCLVDLLARAGFIDEALDVVSNMPMQPDVVIWRSLVDACCKNNAGFELSGALATQIAESNGSIDSGAYVLISRVYASANRWNEVGLVRKLMTDKGVNKEPGCSLVEIDGVTHEFFAGDTTHSQTRDIYQHLEVLQEKVKAFGYILTSSLASSEDDSESVKQSAPRLHSERLAIALALLKTKPGVPIRIFKNLRICGDCHHFFKLISKVYNVHIIISDRLRFHHFREGFCSCKDYW